MSFMPLKFASPKAQRQRGITLVIVLIFLVVLTLLGITGMRTTRLQEQMASSRYERVTAIAAAHAGISDGRQYVQSIVDANAAGAKVKFENELIGSANEGWTVEDWVKADTDWYADPRVVPFGKGNGETYAVQRINNNPGYFVHKFGAEGAQNGDVYNMYRVTARGEGGRATNSAYLQSQFVDVVSVGNP
jgi:type IV pilus assembly protein PilX